MIRFLSVVAMLVTMFALPASSQAGSGTYTYDSQTGYYLCDGAAYTRTDSGYWYKDWYQSPGYYYCNVYYPGTWSYSWKWYPQYTYTVVQVSTASGFDVARKQLYDLKAAQQRVEGRIRERAAETMLLGETAKQLGLQGSFYSNDLSANPFGAYPPAGLQSLGAANLYGQQNGNTQFGYSYKQAIDSYGQLDRNAIYAQASRHVLAGADAFREANTGHLTAVREEGANAARIAEINANRDLAVALQQGAKPQASTRIETTIKGTGSAPALPSLPSLTGGELAPAATVAFDRVAWIKQPGPAACAKCHGTGTEYQKDFDLATYDPDTSLLRPKVLECMSGQSKTCKMPKGAEALPPTHQLQLLTRAVQAAKE